MLLRSRLVSLVLLLSGLLVAAAGLLLAPPNVPLMIAGFVVAAWAELSLWSLSQLPTRSRTARN